MNSFSFKSSLALLIISFIFFSPLSALSDQRLGDIQNQIKSFEEEETNTIAAITFWQDTIGKLKTGNYLVLGRSGVDDFGELWSIGFPVTKEEFNNYMAAALERGGSIEQAENYRKQSNLIAREMLAQAPGEIRRLESELKQTQRVLSDLRNEEQIYIRTEQSSYNPVGKCNWQACPCQWLAHTCTGGAITGTTKESCEKWGGTYWHTNGHCGKGRCSFSSVCPMPGHLCCM